MVLMNFVTASIPAASALREDGLPLQGPDPVAISVFPSFSTRPQLMLFFLTLPSDAAISSVDVPKWEIASATLLWDECVKISCTVGSCWERNPIQLRACLGDSTSGLNARVGVQQEVLFASLKTSIGKHLSVVGFAGWQCWQKSHVLRSLQTIQTWSH